MIQPQQESDNQHLYTDVYRGIEVYVKREDLLHSEISGNKFRKLKYNLLEAKRLGYKKILTFGGAYSNHIAAVAAAGRDYGFETIGVIRGEELSTNFLQNPTLSKAHQDGMQFHFVSRSTYRTKENIDFINSLHDFFGHFYLIPEGGTNSLAIKGCEEILTQEDEKFDFICCAAGTGGTASGIINSLKKHQTVLAFSVLKGNFLYPEIEKRTNNKQWHLVTDYHFGGYAKTSVELNRFIYTFTKKYLIPLEPVYTGKVFYGVLDLISENYFPTPCKILIIHTGGLQGLQSNLAHNK